MNQAGAARRSLAEQLGHRNWRRSLPGYIEKLVSMLARRDHRPERSNEQRGHGQVLTVVGKVGPNAHTRPTRERPQRRHLILLAAVFSEPAFGDPLVGSTPHLGVAVKEPLETVHSGARWDSFDAGNGDRVVGGGHTRKRRAIGPHTK